MPQKNQSKRTSHPRRAKVVRRDDHRGDTFAGAEIRQTVEGLFINSYESTPEADQVGAAVIRLIDAVAYEADPSQRIRLADQINMEVYAKTMHFCEAMDQFAVRAGATLGEGRPAVIAA